MMDFFHKPVLLDACIIGLDIKPDGIYIDGTAGGGGHSQAIFERLGKSGVLLMIDQDEDAINAINTKFNFSTDISSRNTQEKESPVLILEKSNFKNISEICQKHGIEKIDGMILDLGVSSFQLDEPDRGFSYMKDAPLDMRMDRQAKLDAFAIVNEFSEKELTSIISRYGEENWAARISAFIVKARESGRIKSTGQLVDIIKSAIPAKARKGGPHPAKRTFQALRIAVNDELSILQGTIEAAAGLLNNGGRLCIISFHSLEDRIVKHTFVKICGICICPKDFPVCICGGDKNRGFKVLKPVRQIEEENEENPRGRSATLRVLTKENLT